MSVCEKIRQLNRSIQSDRVQAAITGGAMNNADLRGERLELLNQLDPATFTMERSEFSARHPEEIDGERWDGQS